MSIFSKVQAKKPGYNTFDLSHDRKMSMKFGSLVPVMCLETVPGDSFRVSTAQMLRFAPMIAPVMHKVTCYWHAYFVPNRILWKNWEKFITGGRDGNDTSVFPNIPLSAVQTSSLSDYLGLPTWDGTQSIDVSAMPFAVYFRIWYDYYRDQNLDDTVDILEDGLADGSNIAIRTALSTMRTRAWQHDYFTSALPWTQRGPEATIPLGTEAPVAGSTFSPDFAYNTPSRVVKVNNNTIAENALLFEDSVVDPNMVNKSALTGDGTQMAVDNALNLRINPGNTDWYADLSAATASSINDLRRAFKLQEWLEKNARGGARYTESILSHFGVRSSDARLQRPEFLGGGSAPVVISEVLQTSDSNSETTPQANMAGHGISVGSSNSFSYRCEEHGYVMMIMSVLPLTAYQQGIPRHFRKFDKFDYFWPSFAHLGEQPTYNWELYNDPDDEDNTEIFGYLPRYSEYKFIGSSVHGDMRTNLDFWHMGRVFANRPALNTAFVYADDVPTRIFAVDDDSDYLYVHLFHQVKAKRPMPYFGTPNF